MRQNVVLIFTTLRIMVMKHCITQHRMSGISLLGVMLLLPTLILPFTMGNFNSEGLDLNGALVGAHAGIDPRMHASHEVYHGQDVVWQIPLDPKAILFIAQGSEQIPFEFFDKGPKCQRCCGKPENRAVTMEALKRGYAVVMVASIGNAFETWPLEESKDLVIVSSVIKEWTREHSLESFPLSVWGHSAGGSFVTGLALIQKPPVRAIVLMCSRGQHQVIENANVDGLFPPTFFAYMPMDTKLVNCIETSISILRERRVEVAVKQCWPKPLSPLFFTDRIPCMSNVTSEEIFMAFKAEGLLDKNGYLKRKPPSGAWSAVLLKWDVLPGCPDSGDCHPSSFLAQELKMAYAEHSFTSDANQEIFSWLESRLLTFNALTLKHVEISTD